MEISYKNALVSEETSPTLTEHNPLSLIPPQSPVSLTNSSFKQQLSLSKKKAPILSDEMDNETHITLDDSIYTDDMSPDLQQVDNTPVVVGSELEIYSARSADSNVTDKNSLFQRSDMRSIESYMSQILPEHEDALDDMAGQQTFSMGFLQMPSISTTSAKSSLHNINDASVSSTDNQSNNPPAAISSSLKPFPIITSSSPMAHVNSDANLTRGGSVTTNNNNGYEVKLLNISAWKLESTSVQLRALNFKIAEFISYRESLLNQLESLLQSMDRAYWKYAVVRIETVAKNVPQALMYEPVVLSRNRVFMMQQQISVCLAHIRAISISICESVVKLRSLCRKEIETTAPVSIYYKGENYLVKMWSDLRHIVTQSPTLILYWMGFVPDPLIIPPEEHMHRPRERWLSMTKPIVAAIKKDLIVKRDREKRAAHQQLHRIRMSVQSGRGSPRISTPPFQSVHNKVVDSPDINGPGSGSGSGSGGGRQQQSAPASTPPAATITASTAAAAAVTDTQESAVGAEDALLLQAISTPTSRLIRRAGMLMSHAMEKQLLVENLQGPGVSSPVSSRPSSSLNPFHPNNKNSPASNGIPLLRVESSMMNRARQPLEDWEQLREYCRHSWKRLETDLPVPSPQEYMQAVHRVKSETAAQTHRPTTISSHHGYNNHFPSPPLSAHPSLNHHHSDSVHHHSQTHIHLNTGSSKLPMTSLENVDPHHHRPISFSVFPYPPTSGTIVANDTLNSAMSYSFDENNVNNDDGENNVNQATSAKNQFQITVWTQQLDQAVDAVTGTGQGFFSAHVHASTFVMEAAFGFNEAWPSISIVPVLPAPLRQRCVRLYEEVLLAEVYNVLAIDETRQQLQEKQMEHFMSVCRTSFTVLPADVPTRDTDRDTDNNNNNNNNGSVFSESVSWEAVQWTGDLSVAESEALAIALSLREQLTQRRWQLWHDTQQHLLEDSTADAYHYNPSLSTQPLHHTEHRHRHDPLRTNTGNFTGNLTGNLTGNFTVKDNLKKKHHKKRSILIPDNVEMPQSTSLEMGSQQEMKPSSASLRDSSAAARPSLQLTSSPFQNPCHNQSLVSSCVSAVTKVHHLHSLETVEDTHTVHRQHGVLCLDEDDIAEEKRDTSSVFLTDNQQQRDTVSSTVPRHTIATHHHNQKKNIDDTLDALAAAIVEKAPPPPPPLTLTLKRTIAVNLRDRVDDERRVVALNPSFFETHTHATADCDTHTDNKHTNTTNINFNFNNNFNNMFILRPDRKRHRQREMDRLDAKYKDLHATNIQRMMRAFLAKKKTRKLRNQRTWRRVLTKLQTLVRGFISRLRRKREAHEAKIAIFIVRKQALARFRAAVTITRAFRSLVNLKRLMKREPLLPDKLDKYGKPVSQSEQRRTLVRLLQKKPSFLIAATDALSAKTQQDTDRDRDTDRDKKTHKRHHHHHHHHQSRHRMKKEHDTFDPAMVVAPHLHPQLQLLMNKSKLNNNNNSNFNFNNNDDESVLSSSSESVANQSLVSRDSGVSSTNSSVILQRIQRQKQRQSRPFTPILEARHSDDTDEQDDVSRHQCRRDDSSVSDEDSVSQQFQFPSFFDQFDRPVSRVSRVSSSLSGRQRDTRDTNNNNNNNNSVTATEWAATQLRLQSDAAAFVRKLQLQQVKPPPDRLRHSRLLPGVLGHTTVSSVSSVSSAKTPSNNPNSRLKPLCRKTPLTFMDFNRPSTVSSTLTVSSSTDSFFQTATQQATGTHQQQQQQQQWGTSTPSNTSFSTSSNTPLPSLSQRTTQNTPSNTSSMHPSVPVEEVFEEVSGPPLTKTASTAQDNFNFNLQRQVFKPPPIVTQHSAPHVSVPSPFAPPPTVQLLSVRHGGVAQDCVSQDKEKEKDTEKENDTDNPAVSCTSVPNPRDTVSRYESQMSLHAAVSRPNDVYQVPIGISTSSKTRSKPFQKGLSSSLNTSLNTSSFMSGKSSVSNNNNFNNNNFNINDSSQINSQISSQNAPAVRGIHSVRQARLEAKRLREEAETARMREALARLIL